MSGAFIDAARAALDLLWHFDARLAQVVGLSLAVSSSACALAAAVGLAGGSRRPLGSGGQVLHGDSHSSLTRPPGIDLRTTDGALVRTLAEPSTLMADHFGFSRPELVTVKEDDGFALTAMLMKPGAFDASKRYP